MKANWSDWLQTFRAPRPAIRLEGQQKSEILSWKVFDPPSVCHTPFVHLYA